MQLVESNRIMNRPAVLAHSLRPWEHLHTLTLGLYIV